MGDRHSGKTRERQIVSSGVDFHGQVHSEPELCSKEFKAHDNIVSLLQSQGLQTTPHAYGLETAFVAEYGTGGRPVIFHGGFFVPSDTNIALHSVAFSQATDTPEVGSAAIAVGKGMAVARFRVLASDEVAMEVKADFYHNVLARS